MHCIIVGFSRKLFLSFICRSWVPEQLTELVHRCFMVLFGGKLFLDSIYISCASKRLTSPAHIRQRRAMDCDRREMILYFRQQRLFDILMPLPMTFVGYERAKAACPL